MSLQKQEKIPDYIIYDESKEQDKTQATEQYDSDEDYYQDENDIIFSKCKQIKTCKLGKYDPKYEHLVVIPGINLKGMCKNQGCQANNQDTWIRIGYGEHFDMAKTMIRNKCPCCKQQISKKTITTMGFTKAKITLNGARIEGEDDQIIIDVSETFSQTQGEFKYFADVDGKLAKWAYLYLKVQKV